MKSEPDEFGIDDLAAAPGKTTAWAGVRNYQARNFMRAKMRVGDKVFFYHSSCPEPGIAGIAEVASMPYPDASQFDPKSPYFDETAKRDAPGGALSPRVQRCAPPRGQLPRSVQDTFARHRSHAAAARAVSAGRGDPVLGHSHHSRRDGTRALLRRWGGSALRTAAARRSFDREARRAR